MTQIKHDELLTAECGCGVERGIFETQGRKGNVEKLPAVLSSSSSHRLKMLSLFKQFKDEKLKNDTFYSSSLSNWDNLNNNMINVTG